MIRRTLESERDRSSRSHVFAEFLYQSGFANPGLTAYQHYLAVTGLDLRPAFLEETQLLFPADKRVRPLCTATLRSVLSK